MTKHIDTWEESLEALRLDMENSDVIDLSKE